MWTKQHRERHEAHLKEMVSRCAVEQMACWLERADPPRSHNATPILAVVRAIAWHLRVGGSWRALPNHFPAAISMAKPMPRSSRYTQPSIAVPTWG